MTAEQQWRMEYLRRKNLKFVLQCKRAEAAKKLRERRAIDPTDRAYWLNRARVDEARKGELGAQELETLFTVLEREAANAELSQDHREAHEYIVLAKEVFALWTGATS